MFLCFPLSLVSLSSFLKFLFFFHPLFHHFMFLTSILRSVVICSFLFRSKHLELGNNKPQSNKNMSPFHDDLPFLCYNIQKLTGSKVNPLTPFPVDNTTIVALPNNAYPAATKCLPGCSASLIEGESSDT